MIESDCRGSQLCLLAPPPRLAPAGSRQREDVQNGEDNRNSARSKREYMRNKKKYSHCKKLSVFLGECDPHKRVRNLLPIQLRPLTFLGRRCLEPSIIQVVNRGDFCIVNFSASFTPKFIGLFTRICLFLSFSSLASVHLPLGFDHEVLAPDRHVWLSRLGCSTAH